MLQLPLDRVKLPAHPSAAHRRDTRPFAQTEKCLDREVAVRASVGRGQGRQTAPAPLHGPDPPLGVDL